MIACSSISPSRLSSSLAAAEVVVEVAASRPPRSSRPRPAGRSCRAGRGSPPAAPSTRSSRPASRTRRLASSCWAREIVVVVTRQPCSRAAWIASPPQPLPISSRWLSGPSRSCVADPVQLRQLRLLEAGALAAGSRRRSTSSARRGRRRRGRCRGRSGRRCAGAAPSRVFSGTRPRTRCRRAARPGDGAAHAVRFGAARGRRCGSARPGRRSPRGRRRRSRRGRRCRAAAPRQAAGSWIATVARSSASAGPKLRSRPASTTSIRPLRSAAQHLRDGGAGELVPHGERNPLGFLPSG